MGEELGELIEGYGFYPKIDKIKLKGKWGIGLERTVRNTYRVYFGCQQIFCSEDEKDARKFYNTLKSAIINNNYEINIFPSLNAKIKKTRRDK